MRLLRQIRLLLPLLALLAAGCAATSPSGPPQGSPQDVAALAAGIRALGPGIDPDEATRAAQIAYDHTHALALAYQITDPPLIHNTKVNLGLKPRGLCKHWAEDMEARLRQENFRTLDIHRAIANADNPFRIDHSTALIARRGDSLYQGIVLDPWRKGGVLFWAPVLQDTAYKWRPQKEVLDERRRRLILRQQRTAAG